MKETFFHDDPLRQFKNESRTSWTRKLVMGLQYLLPILEWGPHYGLELLKHDFNSSPENGHSRYGRVKISNGFYGGNNIWVGKCRFECCSAVDVRSDGKPDGDGCGSCGDCFTAHRYIEQLSPGLNPLSNTYGICVIVHLNCRQNWHSNRYRLSRLEDDKRGIVVCKSFAMSKNYHIDANKEMIAFGMMNILGSFTSCYPTSGSLSQSAANVNAGGKTAASNIVTALAVLFTLVFLTPRFQYTPIAVLSSIIMATIMGIVDYEAAIHMWRVDKLDFEVCTVAYVAEEQDNLKSEGKPGLRFLILDMGVAVGNIDTSGINMFEELKKNTGLFLANPRGEVIEKLNKSKLIEAIGQKRIYLTVGDAVEACNSMLYASKPKQLAIESDYSLIRCEDRGCSEIVQIVDSVFVVVFVIAIEFRRLTSPLSSILANPSSSASTHQTNHGLTEPVRDGEADDGENGRWGQQRMEDGDDGGWRTARMEEDELIPFMAEEVEHRSTPISATSGPPSLGSTTAGRTT
ncbi:hypothetical protein C3L33_07471, partial [Rhododendron williamsianum]